LSTLLSNKLQLQPETKISAIQAVNFSHLYWDVAWFGVAFGSTLSFLPVLATRLGAAGWQVGLITAGPALMSIVFTFPVGRWLAARSLGPAVTKAAVWHRLGYFVLIFAPLILPASFQIWAILSLIWLMAVPGTALAIGFNALLAATVPPEFRGRVVGRRNSLLAGAIMITFVSSGWILDLLPFAWGYAVVFSLGALGAGMSTYHLSRIQVPATTSAQIRPMQDRAQPGRSVGFSGTLPFRLSVGVRLWLTRRPSMPAILQGISSRYRWVMLAYFLFHFTQLMPAALFPLFWVREVNLADGAIGWVNATFYLTMLAVAPFLEPMTKYWGSHRLTAGGAILLALYPLLTALSRDLVLLLAASICGGLVWAILSGALVNRLLEHCPEDDRPAHLAIYHLALNIATLLGTMLGPALADITGLREALLIVFVLRLGSGLALVRWG
jgi:MFS family permease